jgi:Rab GDP dissociation inhibitor
MIIFVYKLIIIKKHYKYLVTEKMDEEYDVIVLGTGMKECLLSGLLATVGKISEKNEYTKVLQLDRNGYYGSESASLNLTNLWKKFREGAEVPKQYGENRDWNVDLIPKFVMANGNLVKLLLKTNVSQYLEWKCVDGSFVYQWDKGGLLSKAKGVIHKVPATGKEALSSGLMSLGQKMKCKSFIEFIQDFDEKDPKTYKKQNIDVPFKELIDSFGLDENTTDFIGHAVALYTDDSFTSKPSLEVIKKLQLYYNSIGRYGDSPFIYPIWGLSGIPEGFSRLCALYGGVYMLNRDIDEILYENGKFVGIKSQGETAKAKYLVAEPSYVAKYGKVKSTGKVIRCICILDHPIPNTKDVPSCQIILPQKQTKRQNDIFVAVLNSSHCVCKKGYYLAIISTKVETNDPESELKSAFEILGPVLEKFVTVSDIYEPVDPNFTDNVYITSSFDPLSHFELDTENVIQMYEKMTGKKLDLEIEEKEE